MRLKVTVRLRGKQREGIRQRQQAKQVGKDEGGGKDVVQSRFITFCCVGSGAKQFSRKSIKTFQSNVLFAPYLKAFQESDSLLSTFS